MVDMQVEGQLGGSEVAPCSQICVVNVHIVSIRYEKEKVNSIFV